MNTNKPNFLALNRKAIALFLCFILMIIGPSTTFAASKGDKFVISKGSSEIKAIALTFDDGGNAKEINAILKVLDDYNVKATFFLNGKFIAKNPKLTKAIAEKGHEVANHTYNHVDLKKLSKERVLFEANATAEAYKKVTGKTMAPYVRPPYGSHNAKVDAILKEAGYEKIVLWNIDTLDWKKRSKSQIVSEVKRNLAPNRIVLMHLLPKLHTYESLPEIIEYAQSKGYKIMTISEIIGKKKFEDPKAKEKEKEKTPVQSKEPEKKVTPVKPEVKPDPSKATPPKKVEPTKPAKEDAPSDTQWLITDDTPSTSRTSIDINVD